MHVVVDDRAGRTTSPHNLARLEKAYGARFIVLMSTLVERANRPSEHGRRLLSDRFGVSASTSKLYLWAWPTDETLVYLDSDVLVERNVDGLLEVELTSARGLGAVFNCETVGIPGFNGGLLVIRPSLKRVRELQLTERWTRRPWNGFRPARRANTSWVEICAPIGGGPPIGEQWANESNPFRSCRYALGGALSPVGKLLKMCEPKFTDQSILNAVFKRQIVSIPGEYNVVRHNVRDEPCVAPAQTAEQVAACRFGFGQAAGAAIVHAVAEPKPWAVPQPTRASGREQIVRRWHERCNWTLGGG